MTERLRWGILGTGNIARQFADGLETSPRPRGEIVAVGSRKGETANEFAASRAIPRAYSSYDELIEDPNVDAVYNSLPNHLHREWTIPALRAGKHVLCEKPLAMNADEARQMFEAARQSKRTLVEAFMYRSHPLTHAVAGAVRSGAIGQLLLIRTSFCYRTTRLENIRFRREWGGGSLMDVGCYCINFSRLHAREEPAQIAAHARMHPTGVDETLAASMRFPSGVLASFTSGMSVHANNTAHLCGTEGYIEVPVPWKPPMNAAQWILKQSTPPKMDPAAGKFADPNQVFHVNAPMDLYALEADDFAATVLDGKPPVVSEADSIGNMHVLDQMRREIGLIF